MTIPELIEKYGVENLEYVSGKIECYDDNGDLVHTEPQGDWMVEKYWTHASETNEANPADRKPIIIDGIDVIASDFDNSFTKAFDGILTLYRNYSQSTTL